MSLLEASGLSYSVAGEPLVENASFALDAGTLTVLIGPNGAGKSTLLRLVLGLLDPDAGKATIAGEDVATLDPVERAQRAAYLPQQRPLVWPQPVFDIVALGRFAFGAMPGRLSQQDDIAVRKALSDCDLAGFTERTADTLSGGELSRVHLARALAAETPLMVADEPVTALDPRYQHQVLRIFSKAANEGRSVLTVLHDLTLAARYADRLIWINKGRIVADGTPRDTITSRRLREVFGIEAEVGAAASGGPKIDILGPA